MIGQTISHYRITEKLGEGGMGVVYKAEDTKLERIVALKFLGSHLLNDSEAKQRFLREAKAAASLHHANICPVHEIDDADGRTFISMAFIEGKTLEQHVAKGPLPLKDALDIGQQIAKGLQVAHEKGIVHRDIKPANVLVAKDGQVTIMDFGLARLTEASRLTRADTMMGTVAYMSPEQVHGMEVDHRSDIWALGVVLYEMITGLRPFKGQYDQALSYEIVHQEPEPLTGVRAGVPMELEWIVGKCLAKEVGERYQNAIDLIVDLTTLHKKMESGKSAVQKTAGGPATSAPQRASKPKRAMAVSVAVLTLLILLAAAFAVVTHFTAAPPTIPTYQRLTFRRGTVTSARFAPDGNTIVYTAAWENGRRELYSTRPESSESRSLNIQDADILAISKTGEMALAQRPPQDLGASFGHGGAVLPTTLLQASLAGGAPRAVLEDVVFADWRPDGELGVVRMIDGRLRLESPVGTVLYETRNRIASFRISPKDGRIAFSERPFGFGGSWQVVTIDNSGEKTVLPASGVEDNLVLAWSPDSDSIWYENGHVGGNTIRALSRSGAERTVQRVPANLRLLDVAQDGRALVSRADWRLAANCLAPGETAERDLSWFDATEVDDMSSDGKMTLLTESGEGGGRQWGVYLRKTTGEPATRLSEGQAFALSPDGSMALTMTLGPPPELVLRPTGAGEPVRIRNQAIRNYTAANWMPDGRQIVFAGSKAGESIRCYIQDIEGGEPRPLTPEGHQFGLGQNAVSPDGKWLAAQAEDAPPSLFPIGGGETQRIPGVEPEDVFLAWSADGRSIFVSPLELPRKIYTVELSTGKRSFWKALAPADPLGVFELWGIQIAADAQSYCYTYARNISDLYLVEGLR